MLRRGRPAAFLSVTASDGSGIAMQALLTFAAQRESAIGYMGLPAPAVALPEDCAPFFVEDFAPRATRQFEGRFAGGAWPVSNAKCPEYLLWLRHKDEKARNHATSVIALADVPPPGALTMFPKPAPLSTMTWSLDLLASEFAGTDWHLVRMSAEAVSGGFSCQSMTLWDSQARPVLTSRQSVAIYV